MQRTLGDTGIIYTLTYKSVRRINLRVRPDGSVQVSAPKSVSLAHIEAFLLEKQSWIKSALEKQQSRVPALSPAYLSGERIPYLGEELLLIVRSGPKNEAQISDGFLFLTVRDESNPAQKQRTLEAYFRKAAQEVFFEISQEFYPAFAAVLPSPPQIKVRNMKSLWGSCAYQKGSITLNQSLVHYSRDCIRAIAAHEYCHFVHPNHGQAFYALLYRVFPQYDTYHNQLNQLSKGGFSL